MDLTPVMEYLRRFVIDEIDTALETLRAGAVNLPASEVPAQIEAVLSHRQKVEDLMALKWGIEAFASYLEFRAGILESSRSVLSQAPTEQDRVESEDFIDRHKAWCLGMAKSIREAGRVFTLEV